ncbi:hypothetical protein BCH_01767 [Brucella sp. 191011898]|nr:hypothetical protein BCH_01767 [Brucella sp. 191011898]
MIACLRGVPPLVQLSTHVPILDEIQCRTLTKQM